MLLRLFRLKNVHACVDGIDFVISLLLVCMMKKVSAQVVVSVGSSVDLQVSS